MTAIYMFVSRSFPFISAEDNDRTVIKPLLTDKSVVTEEFLGK